MLSEAETDALLLSLKVSFWSLLIALPVAVALGWVLARKDFRGKLLVNAFLTLPLVLPPVVTGFVLLILFGSQGWIGGWLKAWFGIEIAFRWTGAAVAAGVMAFPLIVRPIRLSFEAVDPRLEQAAATLGAGRWRRFATIALPLAMPGVLAGAVLGFAKALGEFGATITLVSNIPGETQTLALAVYALLQVPGEESAVFRLTLIAIAISVLAVVASEILARRARRGLSATERAGDA
ncbi:MAG: molybdate ABC transporter permease subunit [Rhodospirillaceae bacterium]|nr:molybdate ABC transporter permease subunit [Rhodospirillaceae bacterium]MYB11798.1 molybdate ABC transporter permease subunit [Rhodospirillaceae bacterium]MYI48272.1 molybdate ABC transporter permease subunit [Rhodospirillaceae bacterium]